MEKNHFPIVLNSFSSKLGILDIFQVNTFEIAKFMFYHRNNLLPPLLLNLFVMNSQIHNYGTRKASNYLTHLYHTNLKQFTILLKNNGAYIRFRVTWSTLLDVTKLIALKSLNIQWVLKIFYFNKDLFEITSLRHLRFGHGTTVKNFKKF